MQKLLLLTLLTLFLSCKEASNNKEVTTESTTETATETTVTYAKGFTIETHDGYKVVTLTNPWPGSDATYTYALVEEGGFVEFAEQFDATVNIPLENIVVTSTTHIPSLELLGVEDKLLGFPNTAYVSSEKTRALIDAGNIKEIGQNESLNIEVLIDLDPAALITFSVEGQNTTVSKLKNTGIPVLYNSDWTENHPLGKAEWIKFFGVLFGKEKEADSIFSKIEKDYNTAKALAEKATEKPTAFSGAMYRDLWYLPKGGSWAAQLIKDANGDYLWGDTEGTGSLSLNLETVLEKAQDADFWIGPGQFTSFEQLKTANKAYEQFTAFKEQKVYSFTTKKGPTGGIIYYELAPNRPDLVLKDMIKILHPDLLSNYEYSFFEPLQ